MKYVIGIDGGGTKFLVRAVDVNGVLLGEYEGPTARHHNIGEEEMARRVDASVAACLAQFDGKREDCLAIAAGISGIDSDEDQAAVDGAFAAMPGFTCPINCMNDAELTHYNLTGGVGVLVIAGTGSIAFAKNRAGKSCRVGGWLYSIMSDEGSGSYITRKALHRFSRWMDGCCPKTPLITLVQERLGITTRGELMAHATEINTPPWELKSLAKEVDMAAAQGDEAAIAILNDAAACTSELATEAIRQLQLDKEDELNVGIWGSAILKSPLHKHFFEEKLKANFPQTKVLVPSKTAAEAACMLALSMVKN